MHRRHLLAASAAAVATMDGAGPARGQALADSIAIAFSTNVTSIDPHFHNAHPNRTFSVHLFDRLEQQDPRQRVIPGLATAWRAVDPTTWEFVLRPGVRFHDGEPFGAEDVLASLRRAGFRAEQPVLLRRLHEGDRRGLGARPRAHPDADGSAVPSASHRPHERQHRLSPASGRQHRRLQRWAAPRSGPARSASSDGCRTTGWSWSGTTPIGAARPRGAGPACASSPMTARGSRAFWRGTWTWSTSCRSRTWSACRPTRACISSAARPPG